MHILLIWPKVDFYITKEKMLFKMGRYIIFFPFFLIYVLLTCTIRKKSVKMVAGKIVKSHTVYITYFTYVGTITIYLFIHFILI